ncbi:putative protein OS=Eoetvoesiella caeni OX=645616 GN=DFR37_101486 PE=4 SV=1 [Eoetvoesiella caeni]
MPVPRSYLFPIAATPAWNRLAFANRPVFSTGVLQDIHNTFLLILLPVIYILIDGGFHEYP